MKTGKLRAMSFADLTQELADAKEELFNLRFQLATNQLDNTAELGAVKKNIARIATVMREQEIQAWETSQTAPAEEVAE
jgi:large subunit ribosomal protein L29